MSGTINKVMMIGHTGDDVKLSYFEGGGCLGRVSLATNESWTDQQGQKQNRTDWHLIVLRNKSAETFQKYVKKGNKVYVEGKLRTRKWTDNNGVEKYSTEINVSNFTFLQNKSQPGSAIDAYESKPNQENLAVPQIQHQQGVEKEDDLPF